MKSKRILPAHSYRRSESWRLHSFDMLRNVKRTLLTLIVMSGLLSISPASSLAQSVSVDEITGPTTPIPSGQTFAILIGYSWSGMLDEIEIHLPIPSGLEFVSAPIMGPQNTSTPPGPDVQFNIKHDLSQPSGVGQLELHVRFRYDSTCDGTKATFVRPKSRFKIGSTWSEFQFHSPNFTVTASAQNRWVIRKDALWCRFDDSVTNSVLYRISVINNESNNHNREGCLALDINSLTDHLQSGATLESVVANPPGYPAPNWDNASPSSGTIQFSSTPALTRLSTVNKWYYVYYWVKYTRPPFTGGQTVFNNAMLSYSVPRCDIKGEMADTAAIKLCEYESKGVMSKSFTMAMGYPSNPYYYPAIAPGCCAAYKLSYTNTGTVNQSGLVMTDVLPTSVNASAVRTIVPAGMTAIVEYLIGTVPTQIGNYTTSGDYTTTATIPDAATHIRWTYTGGVLPIGHTLHNEISFCFRLQDRATNAILGPTSPAIINNATVTQNGNLIATAQNTLPWSAIKPKIIANKFLLDNCVPGAYWPGSTARFRMAIGNLGSENAVNCTITDVLPAGLTIVAGSTRYQWVDDNNIPWIKKENPACGTGSATSSLLPTGLIVQTPTTASGVQTVKWTVPTIPKDCDGHPSYLVIDFDVTIALDPPALAGQYCNQYTITGTGASSGTVVTTTSDNACLIVSASPQANAQKTVGTLINGVFSPSASIPAGGQGYFKLRLKNTGNSPLKNISMLDILPYAGDVTILPNPLPATYQFRGNSFALELNNLVTTTTTATGAFDVGYSSLATPWRHDVGSGFGISTINDGGTASGGWTPLNPTTFPAGSKAFTVDGNSIAMQPGQYVEVLVPFKVAANAEDDSVTCNSFAYQARPSGFGVGSNPVLLRAESPKACVTAIVEQTGSCCDTAYFVPFDHDNVQIRYKTVHVVNLQGSAITSIDVEYRDCSTGGTGTLITDVNIPQAGGDYKEIRNAGSPMNRNLPLLFLPTYRRIPASGNIPNWAGGGNKQSEVMFNIGLNPYSPTTPDVVCIKLIIHHADGGTCEWQLPAWDPSTTQTNGGGIKHASPLDHLYAVRVTIDPTKLPKPIGFVTVAVGDPTDKIVGGSGSSLIAGLGEKEQPISWTFERTDTKALFGIRLRSDTLSPIDVFVASSEASRKPMLRLKTFDTNGDLMGEDSITASSSMSRVDPSAPAGTSSMQVTSIIPNPGSTIMTIGYRLEQGDLTRIEIFDALGKSVSVLSDGYVPAGSHEILVNVGAMAAGTYFVRLTNTIAQASAVLKVVH